MSKIAKILKEFRKATEGLNVSFEEEVTAEKVALTAKSVSLKGVDDDILLEISANEVAIGLFATFDKLPISEYSLTLINEINSSQNFIRAYVDDKGYLSFSHYTYWVDPSIAGILVNKFLVRLVDLVEEDAMKKLTDMTE